jgi:hypothetical protein
MSMLRLPMFPGAVKPYPMVAILALWNSHAARFIFLISRMMPWNVEAPKPQRRPMEGTEDLDQ